MQYNVTPSEQNKVNGDVGLRRMERRRMRAKLKVGSLLACCLALYPVSIHTDAILDYLAQNDD